MDATATSKWKEDKNAETVTNADGGMQSKVPQYRRLDPDFLLGVTEVLTEAATRVDPDTGRARYPDDEYGRPNWHRIPSEDHVEHVLGHAIALLGLYNEIKQNHGVITYSHYLSIKEHAEHIGCRSMFLHYTIGQEYNYQE
jgi:hypothetical protein